MEEPWLQEDETLEDLQLKGLKLLQKKKGFRFGMDSVLLADFADIRPKDPDQFRRLVEILMDCPYTDQLLTGNGWLHISWNPFGKPRNYVRVGYYK